MTLDDSVRERLVKNAITAMGHAYCPYSNFPVGCALVDDKGTIHTGVNVENAAYPNGTCAETGAIASMVAKGGSKIVAIAVAAKGKALATPCGSCRQRISEFATEKTEILICDGKRLRETFTANDLLPHSFGPENL